MFFHFLLLFFFRFFAFFFEDGLRSFLLLGLLEFLISFVGSTMLTGDRSVEQIQHSFQRSRRLRLHRESHLVFRRILDNYCSHIHFFMALLSVFMLLLFALLLSYLFLLTFSIGIVLFLHYRFLFWETFEFLLFVSFFV
jgi:hypothetical protein